MTTSQRLALRLSEIRQRLNEISGLPGDQVTDEIRSESDALAIEYRSSETQYRAAVIAEDTERREAEAEFDAGTAGDGTPTEVRALLARVGIAEHVGAAIEQRALSPEACELNSALEMRAGAFPLRLLAPPAPETRATTTADAETVTGTWLDRLFAETCAAHVGVTMRSVAPGVAAFPVTTAGAAADQLDKSEAASDAAWTVGVAELKPSRNAVRAVFNIEDMARLPGLEEALRRDLAMALTEGIDRTIFLGDAGPATAAQDIVGMTTAANIVEVTLAQTPKATAAGLLSVYNGLIDGVHASDLMDLKSAISVGTYALYNGAFAVAGAADTIGSWIRSLGVSWKVRGGIDTATAANDWGAFIGRQRGIEGAGIAAVWESGMLIRDIYSGASKGEIAITLSYLWNLGFPRPSGFSRVKYVAD